MYAAGHPPLPGIEIETFAHNMPPHWRYLNEKPADLPNLEKIRELLAQPEGELQGVKSVLVGGLMNLREAVHLVGQQSAKQKESGPEFALFDCAMCHHELQTPSWRQARMLSGRLTPGRPQLHRWPSALVDAALLRAAARECGRSDQPANTVRGQTGQAAGHLQQVALCHRPRQEVTVASDELVSGWMALSSVSPMPATIARPAKPCCIDLCRSAQQSESLDYDSARQVAWAFAPSVRS